MQTNTASENQYRIPTEQINSALEIINNRNQNSVDFSSVTTRITATSTTTATDNIGTEGIEINSTTP